MNIKSSPPNWWLLELDKNISSDEHKLVGAEKAEKTHSNTCIQMILMECD